MKKKILMVCAASLFAFTIYAQEMTVTANRTTFGVRGGVNFQNINGKDIAGNDLNYGLKTGFHAGVNAEIPVGTGSYLQPGVLYSVKGAEMANSDNSMKISYVEIPVNFVYKPMLGTGNMLLGFGPYAAFGIGGETEMNGVETDIEFVKDYDASRPGVQQFKRFDAGANFLVGYEFVNNLSFQLNAQLGLVDINPTMPGGDNDKTKMRNTGFGLSLGYRF